MSTFARAWDEFVRAIEEVHALNQRGAQPQTLAELLRYARELLDIIEACNTPSFGTPFSLARVPEPASSLALLGVGLAGLGFSRRRQ